MSAVVPVKEYTWSAEDYGMRECERGGWIKAADYTAVVNKFLDYHYDDKSQIEDLSMMIRRLVTRLRKFDGHDVIAGQAMILLTKYHLQGSPLRPQTSGEVGK